MTREEAKEALSVLKIYDNQWLREAIDMAIEALSAEPNKAVPPSLADVYKWERDIALSQLEEYGICFGEKKRDDLVEVVRCKDCRYQEHCYQTVSHNKTHDGFKEYWAEPIEWCSRGKGENHEQRRSNNLSNYNYDGI